MSLATSLAPLSPFWLAGVGAVVDIILGAGPGLFALLNGMLELGCPTQDKHPDTSHESTVARRRPSCDGSLHADERLHRGTLRDSEPGAVHVSDVAGREIGGYKPTRGSPTTGGSPTTSSRWLSAEVRARG